MLLKDDYNSFREIQTKCILLAHSVSVKKHVSLTDLRHVVSSYSKRGNSTREVKKEDTKMQYLSKLFM